MLVVKRPKQANMTRQQHPVTKHIPRHVPNTNHREILGLDIPSQFAEMTFNGFPPTFGGDAHGFVVIAHTAARGKGIIQPKMPRLGAPVGQIGKGRRALVRRHHQIRIIGIPTDHVNGMNNGFVRSNAVSHIQHAVHHHLIGGLNIGF